MNNEETTKYAGDGFFEGRMGRSKYFGLTILLNLVLAISLFALGFFYHSSTGFVIIWAITAIVIVLYVLYSIQIQIKRAHDFGQAGWWAWFLYIPIVNIFFIFYFLFKKGDEGKNRYGESPKKI